MLGVPYLVGVAAAGPAWVHVPLLIAWLAAYLFSYYAFLALKTRRSGRVRPQLLLYGALAAPSAAIVLVARPSLWAFGPAFATLTAVNAWFAWRKDERSIVNDLAAVTQACLITPVATVAGGAAPGPAWAAAGVLVLYFAGTSFYVKTMIRERGSVGWRRASIAFHVVAALVAGTISWPLGAIFAWLLARATVFPRFRMSPRAVGLVEVGNSAALLVVLVGRV